MLDFKSLPFLEDISVHIINMDTLVDEQIIKNEDGSYSIFLNARLSTNKQREAYLHALQHIFKDDFSALDADEIESKM